MDGLATFETTTEAREYVLIAGTYYDRATRETLRPGARIMSKANLAARWPRVFMRADDPNLRQEWGGPAQAARPKPAGNKEQVRALEPMEFHLAISKCARKRVIMYSADAQGNPRTRLHEKTVPEIQVPFIEDHDWQALWVPPQIWKGQTAFLIGGGPSLKNTKFDYSVLAGKNVIAVNDAFLLGDWPVTIFGDAKWFFTHQDAYRKHAGLKVTNHPEFRGFAGVFAMRRVASHPTIPQDLPWGTTGNTGLAAIWLAAALGAKRAVLLGYDCKLGPNGKSNWHPNNLTRNTANTYVYFRTAFRAAAVRLQESYPEFQVLNAGPDSALTHWPSVKLEELL